MLKYILVAVALCALFADIEAGRRHRCCGNPCGSCGFPLAPALPPPVSPCGFSPCGPAPLLIAPQPIIAPMPAPIYIPQPAPIYLPQPASPCCCRRRKHLKRRSCGSPCANQCGAGILGGGF